jgi:hypothetical protein
VCVRSLDPLGELLRFLVGVGSDHDALLVEANVVADFLFEPAPYFQGLDDHRHFTRIAQLLSHPAPVAAGLFARDMPFLT